MLSRFLRRAARTGTLLSCLRMTLRMWRLASRVSFNGRVFGAYVGVRVSVRKILRIHRTIRWCVAPSRLGRHHIGVIESAGFGRRCNRGSAMVHGRQMRPVGRSCLFVLKLRGRGGCV